MEYNVCTCCFSTINLLKEMNKTEFSFDNTSINCLTAYFSIFTVDESIILDTSVVFHICEICISNLQQSYAFLQKCRVAFQKMLLILQESKSVQPHIQNFDRNNINIEPDTFSGIADPISLADDDDPIQNYQNQQIMTVLQCTKCFKLFSDHSRLTEHMQIHANFKYMCPSSVGCDYETENKLDYILHLNAKHNMNVFKELSDSRCSSNANFCPVLQCNYETTLENKSDFIKHLIIKHKLVYIDSTMSTTHTAEASSKSKTDIKTEPFDQDGGTEENVCVKQEPEDDATQQLSDVATEERIYQLSVNENVVDDDETMADQRDQHSLISTENPAKGLEAKVRKYTNAKVDSLVTQNVFECNICASQFPSFDLLNGHRQEEHPNYSFPVCNVCQKRNIRCENCYKIYWMTSQVIRSTAQANAKRKVRAKNTEFSNGDGRQPLLNDRSKYHFANKLLLQDHQNAKHQMKNQAVDIKSGAINSVVVESLSATMPMSEEDDFFELIEVEEGFDEDLESDKQNRDHQSSQFSVDDEELLEVNSEPESEGKDLDRV